MGFSSLLSFGVALGHHVANAGNPQHHLDGPAGGRIWVVKDNDKARDKNPSLTPL